MRTCAAASAAAFNSRARCGCDGGDDADDDDVDDDFAGDTAIFADARVLAASLSSASFLLADAGCLRLCDFGALGDATLLAICATLESPDVCFREPLILAGRSRRRARAACTRVV